MHAQGWRLEIAGGLVQEPAVATDDPRELGVQDVVVIAVKATALRSVAATIGALLGPDTVVIPAMNGVPWWFFDGFGGHDLEGRRLQAVDPDGAIASAIPTAHVVGCVAHVSARARPRPALVRHTAGLGFILGEPDGSDSERLHGAVELLRAGGFDVTTSPTIRTDIWYKLWGNLTINPISALTGAMSDRILDDELVNAFCRAAMDEVAAIGTRIGCPIDQSPADRIEVTRALGPFKTSMLQDAEAGRPLELDALVAAAREIGWLVGEPTPFVDALLGLTRLGARVRGLYPW